MDLATTFLVLLQPLAEVMTRPSFDNAVTIISALGLRAPTHGDGHDRRRGSDTNQTFLGVSSPLQPGRLVA